MQNHNGCDTGAPNNKARDEASWGMPGLNGMECSYGPASPWALSRSWT